MQDLALELARGLATTASNLNRITKATSEEAARWAFVQWELRKRAAAKFELAADMLFDRDGLEMASHPAVADYHASRFPHGAEVTEIGAGIGADTVALAKRGPVVSYERDAQRVELARHNVALHEVAADLRCEDGMKTTDGAAYVFSDPSRRSEGKRRLAVRDLEPSPFDLLAQFGGRALLGIKLSPMTLDADLAELTRGYRASIEFVSFDRECREALVWAGSSVADEGVFAVHVESGERLPEAHLYDVLPMPEGYIYEADPAAIRAHALSNFGIPGLGDSNGYLTSDKVLDSPWLRGYRVLYSGRGDAKETRRAIQELGGGTPIVKQRGAGVDPSALAKQMRGEGKRALIVLVWTVGPSLKHAIAEPV